MNVILDESALASGATDPLDLLALFAVCAGRRHVLMLTPSSRRRVETWMDAHLKPESAIRGRIHEVLEINQRKSPNATSSDALITVVSGPTDWDRARLDPPHAVRLLQRPLKLLVENSRNARLWIMFDRDAHRDDRSRESDDSQEVRKLAAQIKTPWLMTAHQLERRAIENYVPARTLRDWWCGQAETPAQERNRRQLVDAFLTEKPRGLSAKARQHYNMKYGLLRDVEKKRRNEISQGGPQLSDNDLDPLFRGLDPSIRDVLASGGFDDLAEAFSRSGAIDENAFSEEVDSSERRRMLASLFKRM